MEGLGGVGVRARTDCGLTTEGRALFPVGSAANACWRRSGGMLSRPFARAANAPSALQHTRTYRRTRMRDQRPRETPLVLVVTREVQPPLCVDHQRPQCGCRLRPVARHAARKQGHPHFGGRRLEPTRKRGQRYAHVPFRGRAARRERGARRPSDGFCRRPAASRQDTDAPGETFR